jgi:hypothetical protein
VKPFPWRASDEDPSAEKLTVEIERMLHDVQVELKEEFLSMPSRMIIRKDCL